MKSHMSIVNLSQGNGVMFSRDIMVTILKVKKLSTSLTKPCGSFERIAEWFTAHYIVPRGPNK